MITFAVVSGKGGSGKTILSVALAQTLLHKFHFPGIDNPRILMLDLDFHVRGLTYLLFGDLNYLGDIKYSTYRVLVSDPRQESLSEYLVPKEDEGRVLGLTILPATNLQDRIVWQEIHTWHVSEVATQVKWIVSEAEKAGYDFVIVDTRAGIDNLSLGAALAANFVFIVLEQDVVNFRVAFQTATDLARLASDNSIELPLWAFVPNKVVAPFGQETTKVLKDFAFLHQVPMDIFFLKKYQQNALNATKTYLLKSKIGRHTQWVLSDALQQMRLPYKMEKDSLTNLASSRMLIRLMKTISPSVILAISTILLGIVALSTFQMSALTLTPLMNMILTVVGVVFILLSIIYGWLWRRI